jgi:hypothetical protein
LSQEVADFVFFGCGGLGHEAILGLQR